LKIRRAACSLYLLKDALHFSMRYIWVSAR
jgi:hypothetical protein